MLLLASAGPVLDVQQLLQDKHHQHREWLEWLALVSHRELVGVLGHQGGLLLAIICGRLTVSEWSIRYVIFEAIRCDCWVGWRCLPVEVNMHG